MIPVFLLLSLPAAELWQSDGFVLEGGAFYKPTAQYFLMPGELVESTELLADLLQQDIALPRHIGITTHTARVYGTLTLGENIDLAAAYQVSAIAATHEGFLGASSFLGAAVRTPARRLVDFDPELFAQPPFLLLHNLDQLALSYHSSLFTLVAGRQVLSWGTGTLWNPTDLFSPFAPTDIDREVRRGADALRLSIPLGAVSQVDVIWLPQLDLADNGAVLRGRTNVFEFDFSATAAKYVDDIVLGADFAGDVDVFGVHGEAAWTMPLDDIDASFLRAVLGGSARPTEEWIVTAELYFNGFGAESPEEIVKVLSSDRVSRGEVFGAGRLYAGFVSAWIPDELLTYAVTTIINIDDPGVLIAPSVEYSLLQNVLVRAGAFVPFGAGVDVALFRSLDLVDVVTQSPDFARATTTFGARSEYGLTPVGAFVQVGAYLD